MRRGSTVVTGLVLLALLAPTAAVAKDGDVIRTGGCDAASSWKLKLSPEDPSLVEVEFEVDENVTGHAWRVRLRHNGELAFKGRRTTRDPSGSFTLRRTFPDTAGKDVIRARAVNVATGEICAGRAALRA